MRLFLIVSIIIIAIANSSCSPSENSINTAIAQTQAANPTTTTVPTDTPELTYTPTATALPTDTPTPTETPTGAPTPTPFGGGQGNIAFISCSCESEINFHPEKYDIFTIKPDGSGLQLLIDDPDPINDFKFSPDGQLIVYQAGFVNTRSNHIANADGSNSRLLVDKLDEHGSASLAISWSPDSQRIAYVQNGDLFSISIDDSNQIQITETQSREYNPQWSSDGTKIAFVSEPEGNIYVVDTDGNNRTPVTDIGNISPNILIWSPDMKKLAFVDGFVNLEESFITNLPDIAPLAWSADSTRLLFYYDGILDGGIPSSYLGIYDMNTDTLITIFQPEIERIDTATWSFDERQVLMLLTLVENNETNAWNNELFLINIDESTVNRLTNNKLVDFSPEWIP